MLFTPYLAARSKKNPTPANDSTAPAHAQGQRFAQHLRVDVFVHSRDHLNNTPMWHPCQGKS